MEEGRISSSQLTLLVISFLFGTSLLLSPGRGAGQDSWLATLLGLGEGFIFALLNLALYNRFSGQSLVEINELVWGPIIGKFFSAAFLWYLFHLGSSGFAIFVTLLKTAIFMVTPEYILLVTGLITCIYTCKQGIEVISRMNEVLLFSTLFLFAFSLFLMLNIFEPKNLLPVLDLPVKKLLWVAHGTATFPFGQIIALAMVWPFLNESEQYRKSLFKGLIVAGIILILGEIRTGAVLGKISGFYVFPTYEAYRMINIAGVLTRLELIPVLNFLTMGFIKASILLYATSLGTAQMLKLRTYRPLVFPLGVLMIILAAQNYANISQHLEFTENIHPLYALPFQVILPLITLLMALIRGFPKQEVSK